MIVARCSTQYIDDSLSFTVLDFPFVSMVGGTSPLRTEYSYILWAKIQPFVFHIPQVPVGIGPSAEIDNRLSDIFLANQKRTADVLI